MRGRVITLIVAAALTHALAGAAYAAPITITTAILLTKTVSAGFGCSGSTDMLTVDPGVPVTYCYTAGNIGGAALLTHTLDDSVLGPIFINQPFTINPGGATTRGLTVNACVSETNVATWTAQSMSASVSSTDTARLTVNEPNPAIVLTKTVSTGGCPGVDQITVSPGTNVTYCYQVGNTGNVTFTTHMLIDSELGPITVPPTLLAPGQTTGVSEMQVINVDTTNVATWTSAFTINCGPIPNFAVGGGHTIGPRQITGTASDTDMAQVLVVTPTPTPTSTGTPTGTPTPQENGDPCTTPIQCESMNCVDGVCCDRPCDQPDEICNLPGQEGTCTEFSLAPALGNLGLAAAAALLMGIGGISLALRRRRD